MPCHSQSEIAPNSQELLVPLPADRLWWHAGELAQGAGDGLPGPLEDGGRVAVGPTNRLGDDDINNAQGLEILRSDLHVGGRVDGTRRVAPQDRRRCLRRGHSIDSMLQHEHAVGRGDRHRSPRAALADDDRDEGHAEREASVGRTGDGLGLTALLGTDPWVGAGGVDKGQHRQPELVGHVHQPYRLTVSLRARHAEVVLDAALSIETFLISDYDNGAVMEPAEPPHDGGIFGEVAVAGERREILDQRAHVVEAVWPVGMARHLRLLPGRQLRIGVGKGLLRLLLKLGDLLGNARGTLIDVDRPKFGDLAFELGDRLLEVEIGAHGCGTVHGCVLPCLRVNGLDARHFPPHTASVKALNARPGLELLPAAASRYPPAALAPNMAVASTFVDPRLDCPDAGLPDAQAPASAPRRQRMMFKDELL